MNLLKASVITLGLNSHLSVGLDNGETAGKFLAKRLLKTKEVESGFEGSVIGFGGKISFKMGDGSVWNLVIEPLRSDPEATEVFLNLNHSHRYEPQLKSPLD